MAELVNPKRRVLLGAAAIAAVCLDLDGVSDVQASSLGSSLRSENAARSSSILGPYRQVAAGVLDVGYVEMGPANGPVVILLHGFPYDLHSYVGVAPRLAAAGMRVIVPHLRGHGTTKFLESAKGRSGEQAALGADLVALMDALRIKSAILAGYDWGGRAACVVAALWPDRCRGLISVNSYLIQDIAKAGNPLPAKVEAGFWYQFYFTTERGRAGLTNSRNDIAHLMWLNNSPTWKFDEPTFARSALAFANDAYVDVVIHSYRHRLGTEGGHPEYASLQSRLAAQPRITVPTITLDGDSDGVVAATDGKGQAALFTRRTHRIVQGVGHNVPQEAPKVFADAVLDLLNETA